MDLRHDAWRGEEDENGNGEAGLAHGSLLNNHRMRRARMNTWSSSGRGLSK